MHAERTALDLIGSIYDAAGDASRWPTFLKNVGDLFGSAAQTLYLYDSRNHQAGFAFANGFAREFMRAYDAHYSSVNVFMLRGKDILREGAVCPSEMLCPDSIALKSEFYNDWIAPQRHRYGANAVLLKTGSVTSILGLIRARGARPFSDEELKVLQLLLPHLQRAVQLHQKITALETEKQAAADALNRWSLGVILLNDKSQVLLMNRAAEAILNQNDGLTARPDGLHAAFSEESATLRRLIRGAIATIAGEFARPGGSVALSRLSGKRAWGVLVTPACLHKGLFPESSAACAVFVNDPEAGEKTNRDFLCRVYGLSHAEAGIASLLLEGKEVKEVAQALHVTRNTAKTHLKNIFEKTGTKRQAELVRLLLQSAATVSGRH